MILFIVETLDNDEDRKFILDIYEECAPWMRWRITRYTDDVVIAEDLVHDCIINLIKHIDKLRTFNKKQLRAYIAVAADNTAKSYLKKIARERLVPSSSEYIFESESDETEVEDYVEFKLTYELAKENLNKLSERDRELLILKYGLELSNKEIAAIVGIKEESVKMTVYRSAKRLEKKIKRGSGYGKTK